MLKKIIILIFVTCFACFNTVFAAESGGMPQLNPEFWISQIFWLIITFGILFIVLTKIILPKISDNLETRKSQILENIETADKQKEESQKKIDEYEKIILDSKIKAKNYFNEAREKILEDINKELDEKLFFTLINIIEQDNRYLITTSKLPIVNIDFDLIDLKSRSKNFLLQNIEKPDDELMFGENNKIKIKFYSF